MAVEAFRIQNFMGFEDSGWIELRPITLLFGRNSVGKSAILRALLLLRQSLDSPPEVGPLWFVRDDGLDFGDYTEMVRDHKPERDFSFWFKCRFRRSGGTLYSERVLDAINELTTPSLSGTVEAPTQAAISVRLVYGLYQGEVPGLKAVDLYDAQGDIILSGTRHETVRGGRSDWTFESAFYDLADQPEPNLWPYMEMFTATGFLPFIRPLESKLAQAEEDEPDKGALGAPFHVMWLLLRGLRHSITAFLQGLNYLGPLRAEPQRFYYVPGQSQTLAPRGQHTVRHLLREGQRAVDRVNDWLVTSGLKVQLQLSALDTRKTLYELRLVDAEVRADGKPLTANIREVGFGLTQVLPIIVQAILSHRGATVMIEQPELHLHPRAQAELGDLFIATAQSGVFCILETHSEHLLLRLQTQIAKTTAGQILKDQPRRVLLPDQVGIYFANRKLGISTLARIEIGPYGDLLSTPEGFEDFFSDDALETATRMRIRLTGSRKGK